MTCYDSTFFKRLIVFSIKVREREKKQCPPTWPSNFQAVKMACVFPATQVVVVGGGLAGVSAANTVLEHGCNTILLDKSSFCGGNSTKVTDRILKCPLSGRFSDVSFLRNLKKQTSQTYGNLCVTSMKIVQVVFLRHFAVEKVMT